MDSVTIKLPKTDYNHMMEIIDSVNGLMENLLINDKADEQTKYDANIKLEELRWLSKLPETMNVSIKTKIGDNLHAITDDAVAMIEHVRDLFDDEEQDFIDDAIDTRVTTLDLLKQTVKKYVQRENLVGEKDIQYDALMKRIAQSGTSKLGKEDLDAPRPKRDLSTLASCMIKKEKKVPKKK